MSQSGLVRAIAIVLACGACVPVDAPTVRACSPARSSGPLRIETSDVPGLSIDSASWRTRAGHEEFASVERLDYHVHLRSSEPVALEDIAFVFLETPPEGSGRLRVDADVRRQYVAGEDLMRRDTIGVGGSTRVAETSVRVSSGWLTGRSSELTACPAAVRVVPRRDLALYVQPGASVANTRGILLARFLADDDRPVAGPLRVIAREVAGLVAPRVIVGNLVDLDGAISDIYSGMVVNVSGVPQDSVVAAIVTQDTVTDSLRSPIAFKLDTLEFVIPHLEPGESMGFIGGSGRRSQRTLATLSYVRANVRGRRIATVRDGYRVMALKRIASVGIRPTAPILFAGDTLTFTALALDSDEQLIAEYADLPRQWTVVGSGGVRLSADTGQRVVLLSPGQPLVRVGATIAGVTGFMEVRVRPPRGTAVPRPPGMQD